MLAAEEISKYLMVGMHHSTPEGKTAIASIIARHLFEMHADQAQFWADGLRNCLRDKNQQIAWLQGLKS